MKFRETTLEPYAGINSFLVLVLLESTLCWYWFYWNLLFLVTDFSGIVVCSKHLLVFGLIKITCFSSNVNICLINRNEDFLPTCVTCSHLILKSETLRLVHYDICLYSLCYLSRILFVHLQKSHLIVFLNVIYLQVCVIFCYKTLEPKCHCYSTHCLFHSPKFLSCSNNFFLLLINVKMDNIVFLRCVIHRKNTMVYILHLFFQIIKKIVLLFTFPWFNSPISLYRLSHFSESF